MAAESSPMSSQAGHLICGRPCPALPGNLAGWA